MIIIIIFIIVVVVTTYVIAECSIGIALLYRSHPSIHPSTHSSSFCTYDRIIFRDLKPENVALDVRGDMRLFDFGLVKELKAKDLVEPPDSFKATGLTGSRRYSKWMVGKLVEYSTPILLQQ
jgi:serine/threonine protein kinase